MFERATIRTRVLPLLSTAAALAILVTACDSADPPAEGAATSEAAAPASTVPAEQADQAPEADAAAAPAAAEETALATPPVLLNKAVMARALETVYPEHLREDGVGGTVGLWVYVDETGEVGESEVRESSGYEELDEAALRLVGSMEFSPALDVDGNARAVWISQPIQFATDD